MSRAHHDQRYRAKLKVRERSLATHVPRLRADIRSLRLLRDLARTLRGSDRVSPTAHTKIIRSVACVLDQDATGRDAPAQPLKRVSTRDPPARLAVHSSSCELMDRLPHSGAATTTRKSRIADASRESASPPVSNDRLRRRVDSIAVSGAPSAPIVTLCGSIHGRLGSSTIRQLYQCAPGNSALMHALVDREVAFSSRRVLFFSTDGELELDVSDTDFASGLAPFVYSSLSGLSEMVTLLAEKEKRI